MYRRRAPAGMRRWWASESELPSVPILFPHLNPAVRGVTVRARRTCNRKPERSVIMEHESSSDFVPLPKFQIQSSETEEYWDKVEA